MNGRPERQFLQRVRPAGLPGAGPLYVRRSPAADGAPAFSTGTYMNIFHQKNWRRLTGLSDFTLELRDSAAGKLEVLSSVGPAEVKVAAGRRLSGSGERLVFNLPAEADFCWFDWTPDDPRDDMPEAFYAAEAPPGLPEVRLALVVATFERAEDLRRLAGIYQRARRENKEMETSSDLYLVNNQPRDARALADLAGPGIVLFHNPVNSGGAGGFSRGAREAVAAGRHTHVVFMDDDITIDPEAWLRTLALLRNLLPKYRGQVVAGAMFLRDRPVYCHTAGEAIDRWGFYRNTTGRVELGALPETLALLSALDPDAGFPELDHVPASAPLRPYAGWWYCVVPIGRFKSHGFPLPLLFRGDDQEFSLRLGCKILSLNGICAWHPDIKSKRSDLRNYLEARNHAIWTTLHVRRWRPSLLGLFAYRLANSLAANDYSSAAIVIQALADYRNFHQRRESGVPETEAKLRGCRARFPNDLAGEAPAGLRLIPPAQKGRALGVLAVILTLGGALIPGFFWHRGPVRAPFSQIRGKFPSLCVASTHDPALKKFNRRRALVLSLKGLAGLAGFLVPGRLARKLKRFAAGDPGESP